MERFDMFSQVTCRFGPFERIGNCVLQTVQRNPEHTRQLFCERSAPHQEHLVYYPIPKILTSLKGLLDSHKSRFTLNKVLYMATIAARYSTMGGMSLWTHKLIRFFLKDHLSQFPKNPVSLKILFLSQCPKLNKNGCL